MTESNSITLHLYDTLTAKLTQLASREPGVVKIYLCGPTVYDVPHVGHARSALAPDILVRHLRSKGIRVVYARNITDVDDKILKRSMESGEQPMALSARMATVYQDDMRALGCLAPDVEPRVSEHIPEIIELIQTLIAKGAAYPLTMNSGAVDVYYSVRDFTGYGKLSKRNVEELRVGARIEASDEKRDPLDFALWKGCVGDAWGWESPWGKGRPGWHIECSAMSARHLGQGFDVHAGGMDLIFPHHENEIAQSEAAHPECVPFASIWIHNGFVNVDKEKMAKSLGNFVTVRDVYKRNDPEALRYFLLTVHYRGPILFDTIKLDNGRVLFPGVCDAERRVDYLYTTLERLNSVVKDADISEISPLPKELSAFIKVAHEASVRLEKALDDDLNTPMALSVIADVAKSANELVDLVTKRAKDPKFVQAARYAAQQMNQAFRAVLSPLGLLQTDVATYRARTRVQRLATVGVTETEVEAKIRARSEARAAKDFERADLIRKELDALLVEVFDSPTGTTWRIGL